MDEMTIIKVLIDWTGSNFGAVSEDVPGCVATHNTLEGVRKAFKSAIDFHLEGMAEDGDEIPKFLREKIEYTFQLSTQAYLKHASTYITMTALSEASGINEGQLGHYLQGRRSPRFQQRVKIAKGIEKIRNELNELV